MGSALEFGRHSGSQRYNPCLALRAPSPSADDSSWQRGVALALLFLVMAIGFEQNRHDHSVQKRVFPRKCQRRRNWSRPPWVHPARRHTCIMTTSMAAVLGLN